MMGDGLVWFGCFLFPFSPHCMMSGLLLFGTQDMVQLFLSLLAALWCYKEPILLKLPKIQVMPPRERRSFHSCCPCSALTCPLDTGISSLRDHIHAFPSTCSEQGMEFVSLDEPCFVVHSGQNMI